MSLKIKRILTYVLCFLLAACVALGVSAIIINASKPVLAEGTETTKDVVEWLPSNPDDLCFIETENNEGFIASSANGVITSTLNPYANIIKKTISFDSTNTTSGGYAGNSLIVKFGATPVTGSYKWQNAPRIALFSNCFQVCNAWGLTDIGQVKTTYYYQENADTTNGNPYTTTTNRATVSANVPYTFLFGIENNYVDDNAEIKVVESYDIYFKLTTLDGTITYVDYTFNLVATTNLTTDLSNDEGTVLCLSSQHNFSTSAQKRLREVNSMAKIDTLEHDEDISYYWDYSAKATADKEDGKQASNDIVVDGNLTLVAGNYFYTPDFDNRFSFKFKADDSEGYFTSDKSNYGQVRFQFGQRWSSTYFYLDYKNDKIGIFSHKPEEKTTSTSFVLDIEKEYKISLVIRDVRDINGVLVYRYPVMDIAEIGNESTNFATISLLSNDLVEYNPADTSKLETHFRVDDYQDYYNGNIHGFNCTISAIEPWYEVTTVDGNNTKTDKIKGGDEVVTLTDGADSNKVFLGWITSANETDIYKAGTAPLTADTTYTALYLDTFEVLNYTDMRLVNVQLRFKAAIVAQDWDLVNKYVNWGFDVTDTAAAQVASVQNVVGEDLDFVDGSTTDKTMRITIDLDESQYLTVYTANAFVEITYANSEDGGSETLYADGTCKNSAANVASWAKDNPAEGTTWSDKFIAEFDRIIAGGAAN